MNEEINPNLSLDEKRGLLGVRERVKYILNRNAGNRGEILRSLVDGVGIIPEGQNVIPEQTPVAAAEIFVPAEEELLEDLSVLKPEVVIGDSLKKVLEKIFISNN